MEQRALRRRRRVAVLAVVIVAAVAAVAYLVAPRGALPRHASRVVRPRVDARAPDSARIKVQVLNATRIRGLARRATMHLRDLGFDVVETGTSREMRDSTLVIDRSNHPPWAKLVARAMGGAPVESRPDSSRYLDVTVLIGATWRPPPEPFYP